MLFHAVCQKAKTVSYVVWNLRNPTLKQNAVQTVSTPKAFHIFNSPFVKRKNDCLFLHMHTRTDKKSKAHFLHSYKNVHNKMENMKPTEQWQQWFGTAFRKHFLSLM